jgi:hypothetical protein
MMRSSSIGQKNVKIQPERQLLETEIGLGGPFPERPSLISRNVKSRYDVRDFVELGPTLVFACSLVATRLALQMSDQLTH